MSLLVYMFVACLCLQVCLCVYVVYMFVACLCLQVCLCVYEFVGVYVCSVFVFAGLFVFMSLLVYMFVVCLCLQACL